MRKREVGPLSQCIGKCRYASYEFALKQIAKLEVKYQKPMRCYSCGICSGYHCASKKSRICRI